LTELRARLGATQTHVTEHFRFEEQNRYMDVVRKREPRLERAIQQLAEEHCQLAQSPVVLIELARAATSLDDSFREAVRRWVECVRQHEARENDVVLDAFNLDIGAENQDRFAGAGCFAHGMNQANNYPEDRHGPEKFVSAFG
jgi:hemerythrin-like domain-containing protein